MFEKDSIIVHINNLNLVFNRQDGKLLQCDANTTNPGIIHKCSNVITFSFTVIGLLLQCQ